MLGRKDCQRIPSRWAHNSKTPMTETVQRVPYLNTSETIYMYLPVFHRSDNDCSFLDLITCGRLIALSFDWIVCLSAVTSARVCSERRRLSTVSLCRQTLWNGKCSVGLYWFAWWNGAGEQYCSQYRHKLLYISPPVDIIWAVMIFWRIREKIIRTVQQCTVYHNCTQL